MKAKFFRLISLTTTLTILLAPFTATVGAASAPSPTPPVPQSQGTNLAASVLPVWAQLPALGNGRALPIASAISVVQPPPPPEQVPSGLEVEVALQTQLEADGATGYMIYFREQPDLSPAFEMDWEERGRFVVNALQETAERSQAKVRAYLEAQGVEYQAFWIDNIIVVKSSSKNTFNRLMSFPEIEALRARRTMRVIEPIERRAGSIIPMVVENNISHVQADDVWGIGFDGEGIVVANIDTGVRYTHQVLEPHYRGNLGGGSFDHDYNWLDPDTGNTTPYDDHGHGSHTMGTMVGDDDGTNQVGMAPGAEWIACDACNAVTGCPGAALLTCGQWIAAPYPIGSPGSPNPDMRPHVVNNSWGDCATSYDNWYQSTVDAWHAAGIYPIFSNGNASNCGYPEPPGLNTVGNPARYGNVTGVGSTGQSDGQYASHSNWGPTDNPDTVNPRGYPNIKPQIAAPGVNIRSSLNGSDSDYGSWGGTSMSAPHVSGLIALMWQAAPCLVGDYARTETIIEQTATPIPYATGNGDEGPGNVPNHATGWGEINALAAVQAAIDTCGNSVLDGTVYESSGAPATDPIASASVQATGLVPTHTGSTTSGADGYYRMGLLTDTYTVTAVAYGYQMAEITGVSIVSGTTTTQDIPLTPAVMYVVSGTVTDATTGWPLYAHVAIDGNPVNPPSPYDEVWTDPATGYYSVTLAEDITYTFDVEAWVDGYDAASRDVGPLTGDTTEDFGLDVDVVACTAPGYEEVVLFYDGFETGSLGPSWGVTTTNEGRVMVTTTYPYAGNYSVLLDDSVGGGLFSLAAITLTQDLSAQSDVVLDFWWREFNDENDPEDGVFISDDYGANWYQVLSFNGGPTSYRNDVIDIVAEAAANGLILNDHFWIKFQFYDDFSIPTDGYAVDDVTIVTGCEPQPGGLVVGNTYDENTNASLVGAKVANEDGHTATTAATPDDADVDDGFYTVFSPHGSKTFTATMTGYQADVVTVTVVQSDTVWQDFYLPAPQIEVAPTSLSYTLELGQQVTQTPGLVISNTGTGALDFEFQELPGGFGPAVLGQPGDFTISAPPDSPRRIKLSLANSSEQTDAPAAPLAILADVELVVDDGSAEDAIGLTAGGQFVWLNRFTPDPGDFPFTLDQISVLFGTSVTVGDDMELIIWEDTDGDGDPGTGANFLYAEWVTAQFNDLATWNVYTLTSPVTLYGPGDVLIGAVNRSGASGYNDYPAAIDQGTSQQRSWIGLYSAGDPPDPPTLPPDDTWDIIDNLGYPGNWTLRGSGFFGGLDIPWLSEDPISGTIPSSGTVDTDIGWWANVPEVDQPGAYYADIGIKSNDPLNPYVTLPVTMTVTAPSSWGKLAGAVTSLGHCDVNSAPLEDAELFIEGVSGMTWTLTTGVSGTYSYWFDEAESPLTVTVTHPEHEVGLATGVLITGGVTTTLDFDLRWQKPCVDVEAPTLEAVLNMGMSTTFPISITNTGAVSTGFELTERDRGFQLAVLSLFAGYGEWLYRDEKGIPMQANQGDETLAYPSAYRWQPAGRFPSAPSALNVLIYADDVIHTSPNTFLDQALQALGLAYTAHYGGDWTGFEADLTGGGPWDLVLVGNDYYVPPASTLTALDNYVTGGGKLVFHGWTVGNDSGNALWTTLGFTWVGNDTNPPDPVYWWEQGHPIFTIPESVPEFTSLDGGIYGTYGQRVEPLAGFDPLAGYTTPGPDPNEAAMILGNDGRTVFKGFLDGQNSADLDADTVMDGIELWINLIDGIQVGFSGDVPWLFEDPITGTVAADTGFQLVDVTLDAAYVAQPGQYLATLNVKSNDPVNNRIGIPVTMTVNIPPTWGKLEGDVTSLGYCDASPAPLEGAQVLIENGARVTLTTNISGAYSYWLEQGTYTVTVSAAEHAGAFAVATVVSGTTTTQDFDLRWLEPCVNVTAPELSAVLDMGVSATLPISISNSGAVSLSFELQERDRGFQVTLLSLLAGYGEWVYRDEEGVPMQANQGDEALAYPSAYRWQPAGRFPSAPSALNVLIYADDIIHTSPNTFLDQALQALGLAYTAHYNGDFSGFETDLTTGGPWDMVLFGNDYYVPPASTLTALDNYVTGGGKLVFHGWTVGNDSGNALWTTLGFTWVSNDTDPPDPVYWWEPGHPIFTIPENVPEFTSLDGGIYGTYGQRVEPLAGFDPLAGYTTPGPDPNEAAMILGNDGRTVFKGFLDGQNSADLDADTVMDGIELWINLIDGIQVGFSGDVPWLFEDPITGTLAADTGFQLVDVTLDAAYVSQPGVYYATLNVNSDDPVNGRIGLPVTMTVNTPATWGKLEGAVSSLGYCDVSTTTLEGAQVLIENGTRVTLTTDISGAYAYWLEQGAYTITVSATEHQTGTAVVTIISQTTTTQDFDLRLLQPCISAAPLSMEATLLQGTSEVQTLKLTNDGAAASSFKFREQEGGYITPTLQSLNAPLADNILLMGDDVDATGWDTYRDALTAAGVSWDEWNLDTLSFPTAGELAPYDLLTWFDESTLSPGDAECQTVADWLVSDDKSLFVTGVDFFWDLENGTPGQGEHNLYLLFNTTYLGDYAGTSITALEGVPGDPIGAGLTLQLAGSSDSNGDYADETTGAPTGFLYGAGDTGSGHAALTHHEGANYKTAWLGVNFHNGLTTQSERDQLMENILVFMGGAADVSWLSEDPITGTLGADSFLDIDVTFTALPTMTFGTYTATLIVNTDDAVTPKINIPVTMTIATAASWEKEVAVNGVPTDTSPILVVPSDTVQIVDRIWVTHTGHVTFTLVETWTESLELTGTLDFTAGDVTSGANWLSWNATGVASNTWHVLTKTFHVTGTEWIFDTITETLWVEGADPQPDPRVLIFRHSGVCWPVSIDDLQSNSPVAVGQAMHFTATASGDPPITYTWDFDGPGSGSGLDTATPVFTYTSASDYIVWVTATNACPSSDAYSITVRVNPAPTYTLMVNTVGSGTVNLNPTGGIYDENTVVTLTANANSGWYFDSWGGDLTGSDNPETITMDSDKEVTATFAALPTYTLAVNVVGSGSVTRSPSQTSYISGTVVTLTAVPSASWYFAGWSGDLTVANNPANLTMDSDKEVTATFTTTPPPTHTLAVYVVGNGSVTRSPSQTSYISGTVVQLTAVPGADWDFDSWSGDLTGNTNPDNVTMDGDKAVTATFTYAPPTYTLAVNVVGSGSVTRSPSQTSYISGAVVTLTAVPSASWYFAGWSGDLTVANNPANLTMDSDKEVTATFTTTPPPTHTLAVYVVGNGSITRSPSQTTYVSGTVVQLTAVPGADWDFDSWSGDLTGSANPETIPMDGDKEVTATFVTTGCVNLTSITIAGDTSGASGVYTFTTSYLPPNATLPIAYLWDNGDTTSTTVRSLGVGTATLVVTATNCTAAMVTDTHEIVITAHIYLPLVMRNYP